MPQMIVDISPILRNAAYFQGLAEKNGLELVIVTKFCRSEAGIVQTLADAGYFSVAESDLSAFGSLDSALRADMRPKIRTTLLKTRVSDIRAMERLPPYARPKRVLVTDWSMLKAIREIDAKAWPEILLILEVGDAKEGFFPEELVTAARHFADLPIMGVSANYACLSGKKPDGDSLKAVDALAREVAAARGLEKPYASVGGTVMHELLERGMLAGLASEIRIGEGIFFGYDSSSGRALPGLGDAAFTFRGEILEVRVKDTTRAPCGGHNAFGHVPTAVESGMRRRAVLDFGILACEAADMEPMDTEAWIAGQTYDYTVVDVTASERSYAPGGFMDFRVRYAGASRAFTDGRVRISVKRS